MIETPPFEHRYIPITKEEARAQIDTNKIAQLIEMMFQTNRKHKLKNDLMTSLQRLGGQKQHILNLGDPTTNLDIQSQIFPIESQQRHVINQLRELQMLTSNLTENEELQKYDELFKNQFNSGKMSTDNLPDEHKNHYVDNINEYYSLLDEDHLNNVQEEFLNKLTQSYTFMTEENAEEMRQKLTPVTDAFANLDEEGKRHALNVYTQAKMPKNFGYELQRQNMLMLREENVKYQQNLQRELEEEDKRQKNEFFLRQEHEKNLQIEQILEDEKNK